jgi:toxin HigB-1
MIRGFRHRGLRRLFEDNDRRGLNPEHVDKITRVLAQLNLLIYHILQTNSHS